MPSPPGSARRCETHRAGFNEIVGVGIGPNSIRKRWWLAVIAAMHSAARRFYSSFGALPAKITPIGAFRVYRLTGINCNVMGKPIKTALTIVVAVSMVVLAASAGRAQKSDEVKKGGSWEKIKVHGKSLEGNLEGDSPDRDVFVYLPPSYATSPNRRYPVVYFLHGYAAHAETYWKSLDVPAAADAHEMIVVLPDAFTVYDGSMFSNSPTTGDWETFIAKDLIEYIDSHYRTIPNRGARGLAGHSMGGYGTVRIGMKHSEAFSVLYAMSSCCLMNDPQRLLPGASANQPPAGALAHALSAQAAAWAPDTLNPPTYFDLPSKDGALQPLIAAKWTANSPLVMVDQYVPNLKTYSAIAIDVGTKDPFLATNTQLDQAFTRLGIAHSFETYDGDHGNRITARFAAKVLPFFSAHLTESR